MSNAQAEQCSWMWLCCPGSKADEPLNWYCSVGKDSEGNVKQLSGVELCSVLGTALACAGTETLSEAGFFQLEWVYPL